MLELELTQEVPALTLFFMTTKQKNPCISQGTE